MSQHKKLKKLHRRAVKEQRRKQKNVQNKSQKS